MAKVWMRMGVALCVVGGVYWFAAAPAHALKDFKDQFEAKYVKTDSKNPADLALSAAVQEAKCNICHVGKTKKKRNAYGAELAKLIKKTDKDNIAKIRAALDKVAAMKSDAKDSQAPTFGSLIQHGKLPAGNTK